MLTETEGMVIRQIKATSGRRMVLLFSKAYGKISVGTSLNEKRLRSRSSLLIRPFTYGTYELFRGRNSYDLNGGEVIRSFYEMAASLDKFVEASFVLELTDKALPEELPQPGLFRLLIDFFRCLEKAAPAGIQTLVICYMVQLLDQMGIFPNLEGDPAGDAGSKKRYFSVADGCVLGEDQTKKQEESSAASQEKRLLYPISFDTIKVIRYFQKKPIDSFGKVALREEPARAIRTLLRDYMEYHLGIGPLKSEGMF